MDDNIDNKQQRQKMKKEKPKVIVIGAGMSGLACANELQNRNYDVLVIEARSRPGGRLKGIQMGTNPNNNNNINNNRNNKKNWVDLGGTLIHGIRNNPVHKLVEHISQGQQQQEQQQEQGAYYGGGGGDNNIQLIPKSSCTLINQTADEDDGEKEEKIEDTTAALESPKRKNWRNNNKKNHFISKEQDEKVARLFNECLDLTFQQTKSGKYNSNNNNTDIITPTAVSSSTRTPQMTIGGSNILTTDGGSSSLKKEYDDGVKTNNKQINNNNLKNGRHDNNNAAITTTINGDKSTTPIIGEKTTSSKEHSEGEIPSQKKSLQIDHKSEAATAEAATVGTTTETTINGDKTTTVVAAAATVERPEASTPEGKTISRQKKSLQNGEENKTAATTINGDKTPPTKEVVVAERSEATTPEGEIPAQSQNDEVAATKTAATTTTTANGDITITKEAVAERPEATTPKETRQNNKSLLQNDEENEVVPAVAGTAKEVSIKHLKNGIDHKKAAAAEEMTASLNTAPLENGKVDDKDDHQVNNNNKQDEKKKTESQIIDNDDEGHDDKKNKRVKEHNDNVAVRTDAEDKSNKGDDDNNNSNIKHEEEEENGGDHSNTGLNNNSKEKEESFGDVFNRLYHERYESKLVNGFEKCLFQWHKENLEVSCGASLEHLGFTWNDDEPYGFGGSHVALNTSWQYPMNVLSTINNLNILYKNQVTSITVVPPSQPSPPLPEEEEEKEQQQEATQTTIHHTTTKDDNKHKRKAASISTSNSDLKPSRTSRRILERHSPSNNAAAVDATEKEQQQQPIRRSGRSNKGVPEKRLTVTSRESVSYEDHIVQKPRRKGKDKQSITNEEEEPQRQRKTRPQATVQVTIKQVNSNRARTSNRNRSKKSKKNKRIKNGNAPNDDAATITLQADSVICTLPLGILKLPPEHPNSVTFNPPLPVKKQNAIDRLGCGLLNKCALLFPYVFWHQHNASREGGGNENDGEADFLGVVGSNKRNYLMVNTPNPESPVLVFWFGGDFAKEVESWTDLEIVEDCMNVLRNSCNFASSKKKFTTGITIPQPVDYAVTRWGKEEFSRCSFVYTPPGVNSHEELVAMSEPIYHIKEEGRGKADEGQGGSEDDDNYDRPIRPSILFAGEHTTPYHPSTIHGAYLSGLREAYRLDFAMEPVLNWNYQFSMETLYKRTFAVKPKQPRKQATSSTKDGVAALSLTSSLNKGIHTKSSTSGGFSLSPNRQRKRKGAGTVDDMALRKRPKQIQPHSYDNKSSTTGIKNGRTNGSSRSSSTSFYSQQQSRRSNRSTAGKRSNDIIYDDTQYSSSYSKVSNTSDRIGDHYYAREAASASSQPTLAQPDVSLLRAIESYGITNQEGLDIIQNKTFPAYTSSTISKKKPSMSQKKRQQQQEPNTDDDVVISSSPAEPIVTVSQIKSRYKELLSLQQNEPATLLPPSSKISELGNNNSRKNHNNIPDFLDRWIAPPPPPPAETKKKSASISPARRPKQQQQQHIRPKSGRKRVPKIILDL